MRAISLCYVLFAFLIGAVPYKTHAEQSQASAHPDFAAAFKKVEGYLKDKQFAQAEAVIDEMAHYRQQSDFPAYEEAHFQLANYWLMSETNKPVLTQQALVSLVESGGGYIDSEAYLNASLDLLKQQIESKAYQEAMLTTQWMQNDKEAKIQLRRYRDMMKQVEELINSDDAIFAAGAINEVGQWQRMLIRPALYLEDVIGDIHQYVFDCDQKQSLQTIKFTPEGALKIPASWGNCTLTIEGSPQSSFVLVQYK